MPPGPAIPDARTACLQINDRSPVGGLFQGALPRVDARSHLPWRICPEPFWLTPAQAALLDQLGPALQAFARACNLLYQHSVRGQQPSWVHEYLDQGKPAEIVELGRMNRFRAQLPLVMRPDLLLTDNGFCLVEMDAVPGGIGFTAQICQQYADLGYQLIGGARGLVDGLYEAIAANLEVERPVVAVLVSDESGSYREEMEWLASSLTATGMPAFCLHPRDVHFDDDGLFLRRDDRTHRIDAIYRFFELFDLKNIPKAEPIVYFAKKSAVRVTPPLKAQLEEKLWMGLFWHPLLEGFWRGELGAQAFALLADLVPRTWIVDPRPLPPHAVIAGLRVDGRAVGSWEALKTLTKRQREYVIKPSGFCDLAYESKGVFVGHDMPEQQWAARVQQAVDSFGQVPYILQEFHKASRTTVQYYNFATDQVVPMHGRALVRPYYYLQADAVRLAGVQAVVCPPDKKLLHGMADAVLAPAAVMVDS